MQHSSTEPLERGSTSSIVRCCANRRSRVTRMILALHTSYDTHVQHPISTSYQSSYHSTAKKDRRCLTGWRWNPLRLGRNRDLRIGPQGGWVLVTYAIYSSTRWALQCLRRELPSVREYFQVCSISYTKNTADSSCSTAMAVCDDSGLQLYCCTERTQTEARTAVAPTAASACIYRTLVCMRCHPSPHLHMIR